MLLVSDVHGANDALARVAAMGEPLLVLGDLLNLVDYRTMDGLLAELFGKPMVAEVARLRARGDHDAARDKWRESAAGRGEDLRARLNELVEASYAETQRALEGAEAYVTYGNVDRPDMLAKALPVGSTYLDGETVEIEGLLVGFVGGAIVTTGGPGEVTEADLAAKLERLGPVDILCTHAAPAIPQLATDVIAGFAKQSVAVLEYVERFRPPFHYFGDIHQPQATEWRVGETRCRNVGYFRATGRPVRHA
jgi:Icc-related predicted phosphoesterase